MWRFQYAFFNMRCLDGYLHCSDCGIPNPSYFTQILHHLQERIAFLRMVRVLAAHRAAKTRSLRKVQNLSLIILLF